MLAGYKPYRLITIACGLLISVNALSSTLAADKINASYGAISGSMAQT